jgi:hypothetical protein
MERSHRKSRSGCVPCKAGHTKVSFKAIVATDSSKV